MSVAVRSVSLVFSLCDAKVQQESYHGYCVKSRQFHWCIFEDPVRLKSLWIDPAEAKDKRACTLKNAQIKDHISTLGENPADS